MTPIIQLAKKNIATIISLFIAFFFMQTSVYAQMKSNTMNGSNSNDSLTGITIHQEINFKVTRQRLYQVLLNSKEFSECTKQSFNDFTETSANIDSSVGGTFSVFDGHIIGRILELVPGQRIVEAWRVVDWPPGIYSIVRFEFEPQGSGTKLIFDHTGFPEGLKQHLSVGWQQHYWDALTKYFK